MLNRLRVLETLIKDRKVTKYRIEEWIQKQLEMLRVGTGGQLEKSFDDLFEIIPVTEKYESEQRFYCLTFINSKFISAETNSINSKCCAYCNRYPCSADRLLLSQKVYKDEEERNYLRLYIGCEGYADSPRFVPIKPKPEVGIPYGYYLLCLYLGQLININAKTVSKETRTVVPEELRQCKFFVHSKTKIAKFNRECQPVFKKQQSLETELYKFMKWKEQEEEEIKMCTFIKQIHW